MVLKPPIRLFTPPIKQTLTRGGQKKPAETQSGGSGSGAGGMGGTTGAAVPSFESIFSEMLTRYLPETVSFTPLGEDVLRDTIRNWLRPAYEQAIREREERTARQNAELDADAWARGMGPSTYVTDVKDRAFRSEAQDVSDLESDYASTLAGHLYDAMRAQQEKQLEVDQFNAEQINRAREKAAQAAQSLYSAYLAANRSGGSGSRSGAGSADQTQSTFLETLLSVGPIETETDDGASVDYRTAASLVSRMTQEERRKLYAADGAPYAQQYAEILKGLGKDGFARLMQQFPA